ncbi:DDHD domain-containing protein [Calycina marina]|uniref:DDHD domain-containing protein n=1 Tax=Calycina marina TaxID=1763456 RepID=A0A9P7Z8S2_9HELO|nr:DDHD domain-containing protein [Calycina marina]
MSNTHSYGPSCLLAQENTTDEEAIPKLHTGWFYSSPLPIDDPLSAAPPTGSESLRHPSRPFSPLDNSTIEKAWLECEHGKEAAEIPVGVARLHVVQLPKLLMSPIYWSPVHDIAAVIRGTWFYRDTLLPIEPTVANQLEVGYQELHPWSQTWNDEVNSAIEVGAAGEEKITHVLWPPEAKKGKQRQVGMHNTDPKYAAKHFYREAAMEGSLNSEPAAESNISTRKYATSHVIYVDTRAAFILKPTLQPSEYFGRRPLQEIKRGRTVGIPVIRGFSWKTWDKLNPSKKTKPATKAEEQAPRTGVAEAAKLDICKACRPSEERPEVKDLVLVIHGIGQKLSERVEAFHFTHAINSFRRAVNVELNSKVLKTVLRDGLSGIMVLPVNWRSSLSFEEGGPMEEGDKGHGDFSLRDITPLTIPAVRSLISDVMLDIPFYMSHHKPKMIEAVISEANRVYRLWTQNNPKFHEGGGRVHLIAHSLGSAMAMEVLSKQPVDVPCLSLQGHLNRSCFDFKTTNLFFAGSPAGFFLLLDKANLVPRKGLKKIGAEDDHDERVTQDAGKLGCLAVDNIYNIIAANDPIAYRLNSTVDTRYSLTLKDARVPSSTVGIFASLGNAIKSVTPGVVAPSELPIGQVAKTPMNARLPSQVEMAVHDFTREELAEKKFMLLNDNGQIDWFLSSGGGPLEFQYWDMLGAHSSYWKNPDFLRMVVIEIGRRPGKHYALPNMIAVKKPGHR